ncbi:MAG: hotdog fold thioesterase [Tetrasphaera sp.]|jgi:1,4-dihydroxy-2-naphthoyl-CoA hydrolase|nr:hotdog fold thioesterase [Tetrasphaera sp.]
MTVDITTSTPDEVLAAVREMEALNPRSLNARMGIEVIEASAERLVATMPVEGNTQPYGLLHGGASVVLAETLGSVGAAIHAGEGKIVVGVDINATHHRAARTGLVTGVATPLSVGNTLSVWEIVVTDEDGKRVCTSRITCLIRERPPGA